MLTIEGQVVTSKSKEGVTKTMPLDQWLTRATGNDASNPEIMPDGVKAIIHRGGFKMMVHQTPPQLRSLKWIREDSPVPYGTGATYRDVTVALPYVIVLAVFQPLPNKGGHLLSRWNECFFSRTSITSLNDESLCYPGLLNCSKWPDNNPNRDAAWICTQYLNYAVLQAEPDAAHRTNKGLSALIQCLFDSGFNYSSEHHEGNSWYTATKGNDERISTIKRWEKESAKNPLFVLDVPWISTGRTINTIVDQVFGRNGVKVKAATTSTDLERIVNNHK